MLDFGFEVWILSAEYVANLVFDWILSTGSVLDLVFDWYCQLSMGQIYEREFLLDFLIFMAIAIGSVILYPHLFEVISWLILMISTGMYHWLWLVVDLVIWVVGFLLDVVCSAWTELWVWCFFCMFFPCVQQWWGGGVWMVVVWGYWVCSRQWERGGGRETEIRGEIIRYGAQVIWSTILLKKFLHV